MVLQRRNSTGLIYFVPLKGPAGDSDGLAFFPFFVDVSRSKFKNKGSDRRIVRLVTLKSEEMP